MVEKVFTIDRNFVRQNMAVLQNINDAILVELQSGRPVFATVTHGTYAGSLARLVTANQSATKMSKIFSKGNHTWDINVSRDLIWEVKLDGSNRSLYVKWFAFLNREYKKSIKLHIGREDGTIEQKNVKHATMPPLQDFLGNEIHDGDYVLMHNSPWDVKTTGSPFRMLRYKGVRTNKQAQFVYVKMGEGKYVPDGNTDIRVGLNTTDGADQSTRIFGVKVSVDESLATAMQMIDHDMSQFPLSFHVGLRE
jgi:hypothetical protein